MSYLAMSAEPINNENNTYSNDNSVNKKRQHHNKTQKYRNYSTDFNPQKVNSVLETIHNAKPDTDDELGNYIPANHSENFKPLNPFSFDKKEAMTPMNSGDAPQPTDNADLKLQELQSTFMNDAQVRDYYRKLAPSYTNTGTTGISTTGSTGINTSGTTAINYNHEYKPVLSDSNQLLIEKLNYMINLLEEQQDHKTESVTEEVVLYSFLGVFIIFIVDSFTKVGKYVR